MLTTRNTLSEVQKPKENNSLLNTKAMYNFLRKEERKRVIAQNHMDVPTYNDFTEYDVLFDVFKEIPMTKLHNNMISEVEVGNMKQYKDEFLAAPAEIKLSSKMTKKDKNKLYHFLKGRFTRIILICVGKQNELFAIRELLEKGLIGDCIQPIFEPIKYNTTTFKNTLQYCGEKAFSINLVVNSKVNRRRD